MASIHRPFQKGSGLLSSKPESWPRVGWYGGPGITGTVPNEKVGHKSDRVYAMVLAKLHNLFGSCENGSRENVLGTLFPCSEGTTRLDLLAEDQPNEHVEAADREKEEGRDEGEGVNVMG